jgi:hypothetical protein
VEKVKVLRLGAAVVEVVVVVVVGGGGFLAPTTTAALEEDEDALFPLVLFLLAYCSRVRFLFPFLRFDLAFAKKR